jgi:hypothetical protein
VGFDSHRRYWTCDEVFELPPDKPLTLAAYAAGSEIVAYTEPVAVGDILPDRPIFLTPDYYVNCPLEAIRRKKECPVHDARNRSSPGR